MRVFLEGGIRCPANQYNIFILKLMQQHYVQSRRVIRNPFTIECVDEDCGAVILIKLMQFDEDGAACIANAWRVRCANGISYIAAGGVAPVLIAKFSLQHEKLLAAAVNVRREVTVRGVADQRRRTCDFIANSIQHHALDTGHG